MSKYLESLLISAAAVFAPIETNMIVVFVLIIADLIFGIIASLKQGQSITSAGLRRTVSKTLIYEGALLSAFLVDKYLTMDLIPVLKLVSCFIGVVELKSVLENLDIINGSPVFASLITKLGSKNDKIE